MVSKGALAMKLHFDWRDKAAAEYFIGRLRDYRQQKNGSVTYTAFFMEEDEAGIRTSIRRLTDTTPAVLSTSLHKALFHAEENGLLNATVLR